MYPINKQSITTFTFKSNSAVNACCQLRTLNVMINHLLKRNAVADFLFYFMLLMLSCYLVTDLHITRVFTS